MPMGCFLILFIKVGFIDVSNFVDLYLHKFFVVKTKHGWHCWSNISSNKNPDVPQAIIDKKKIIENMKIKKQKNMVQL